MRVPLTCPTATRATPADTAPSAFGPSAPDSEMLWRFGYRVIWFFGGMRVSLIRHLHMFATQAACPSGMGGLPLSGAGAFCKARGLPVRPSAHGWQGSVPQERSAISGVWDRERSGRGRGGRCMRFWPSPIPNNQSRLVPGVHVPDLQPQPAP